VDRRKGETPFDSRRAARRAPHERPYRPTLDTPQARAALAYARRGWAILPCTPGGRVPILARGFHDANAGPATVAA
jgi:hypothetical protein